MISNIIYLCRFPYSNHIKYKIIFILNGILLVCVYQVTLRHRNYFFQKFSLKKNCFLFFYNYRYIFLFEIRCYLTALKYSSAASHYKIIFFVITLFPLVNFVIIFCETLLGFIRYLYRRLSIISGFVVIFKIFIYFIFYIAFKLYKNYRINWAYI